MTQEAAVSLKEAGSPLPAVKSAKEEIPDAIKLEISSMTVTTLVYSSDPSSRIVGINGKVYREGQLVREELTLEEIARDELIFSFRGHLLKKKVY